MRKSLLLLASFAGLVACFGEKKPADAEGQATTTETCPAEAAPAAETKPAEPAAAAPAPTEAPAAEPAK